jgi:hypothetical protein
MPNNRTDPVSEVQYILKTYSGPALIVFKMCLALNLQKPDRRSPTRSVGVERSARRILRMLRGHPDRDEKLEAIRKLLNL